MDRRLFLRSAALLGGGLVVGSCGDDGGAELASPTSAPPSAPARAPSSAPSTTTVPYDPSRPYWLQGGFAPVAEEVSTTELTVHGAVPSTLHGLYTRNGSNPATGNSPHWFFGDGMIHGLRFEHGQASWYANRYVGTPMYTDRREFGEFTGAPGGPEGQSNVSIFAHGGRLFSLGEVGWPYEIDPVDLSTRGPVDFSGPAGAVGGNVTAHPKRDPDTGLLHFFGYGFTPPYLTYYVASADGRELLVREEIAVGGPTMIHDFAITESDVVFWEFPVVFDLGSAAEGALNPFQWDPSYGSRIGVMPLGGPASAMRWVEIDNGYVFHGTNAHRDGDRIVLDVSRMDSVFDGNDISNSPSLLTRWELDTAGEALTWSSRTLSDVPLDLPEIDDRRTGRPHRVAWLLETEDTDDGNLEFTGVTGYDVETGALDRWSPGPRRQPNEVTFVPDGPGSGEGEGWLLTFVWDRSTDGSALAILDATDVAAGPVATVELPQRVPFGFHGTWLPGD